MPKQSSSPNSSSLAMISFDKILRAVSLWGRHPNRLQPGMCTARARFHPLKIRAHIVPRQVQHLAPELPIFLDLRLGLRRSPSELALWLACRRDPPHRRLEGRVLEVEVNPELRAQVGMPWSVESGRPAGQKS